MAFDRKQLSGNIGVGSNAPTMFSFRDTASNKAAVATADYFLPVTDNLEAGDTIYCHCSEGGMFVVVTAATAATVTVEMLEITTV